MVGPLHDFLDNWNLRQILQQWSPCFPWHSFLSYYLQLYHATGKTILLVNSKKCFLVTINIMCRYVGGVCNFLGSVFPQQRFETQRMSVTACLQLRVLFSKPRKVHPRGVRAGWSQRRGLDPSWFLLFIHLSLAPSLPYGNWPSQGGCFSHLRFLLWSSDFLLFHFCMLFAFFVFYFFHLLLLVGR